MDHKPTMDDLLAMYMANARVPIDELKRHPHGAFFPNPEVRVAPKEPGWDGRLDLANVDMMRDLAAIGDAMVAAVTDGGDYPFRLISRRMRHVYNSATNHPATHRGRPYNPAFMHPADLETLGLQSGDVVEISSPHGTILGVVEPDDSVRPGLVSMAHGFGSTPEDDARVRAIGGPTARLLSVEHAYDRYTGQPRMSNIPVRVAGMRDARMPARTG
jgi:anaerobic selenocysteine-containing dehydrogenase